MLTHAFTEKGIGRSSNISKLWKYENQEEFGKIKEIRKLVHPSLLIYDEE